MKVGELVDYLVKQDHNSEVVVCTFATDEDPVDGTMEDFNVESTLVLPAGWAQPEQGKVKFYLEEMA
jgi:hypothetical protein